MPGPSSYLLLPSKLTDAQIAKIQADVLMIGHEEASAIEDWKVYVVDTRPIGGSYVGESYPFGIDKEAITFEDEENTEEYALLQTHFGFVPVQTMEFDAWVNGKASHRILGELTLHFAKLFGGIVNFNGALLPYNMNKEGLREDWSVADGEWSEVKPFAENMINSLPGKTLGIEYRTANGRTWICHYGDAAFLQAWLQHPYFHMIK